MSFIIGSKCVSTCDTACVDVCPVACIHGPIKRDGEGREVDELRKAGKLEGLQLFINPDECIDCGRRSVLRRKETMEVLIKIINFLD